MNNKEGLMESLLNTAYTGETERERARTENLIPKQQSKTLYIVTAKLTQMKNSISGWLKKPKAETRATTKGKSRSQPNKGELKPRRVRRPRPRLGLMWLRA